MFMHPADSDELFITAVTGVTPLPRVHDILHDVVSGAVLHVKDGAVTVAALTFTTLPASSRWTIICSWLIAVLVRIVFTRALVSC